MKKRFIIISSALFIVMESVAQGLSFRLNSEVLIENAIKEAISIEKSTYCLKDKESGERFGRKGENHYGQSWNLAFHINGHCIALNSIMQPWKGDKGFDKYRSSNRYEPELLNTSQFKVIDGTNFVDVLSGEAKKNESLQALRISSKNLTWIIWVTMDVNEVMSDSTRLHLFSVDKEIDFEDSKSCQIQSPMVDKSVLGGMIVKAEIPKAGVVEFKAVGLLERKGSGWVALQIPGLLIENKASEQEVESSREDVGQESELTPLSKEKGDNNREKPKKSKRRKND